MNVLIMLELQNQRDRLMTLTTPALLFPAISLLLLAYTNRFLVIAQLIRQLHGIYLTPSAASKLDNSEQHSLIVIRQINNLRKRVSLIRTMQALGVLSFILCTLSMFCLYIAFEQLAQILFGVSLITLVISLLYSLYEIAISTKALEIELEDLESKSNRKSKVAH